MVELSVIVPAFNEEKEIHASLSAIEQALKGLGLSYEIIAVDDGSRDGTLAELRAAASGTVKIFSYLPNRGKGFAVRHGMLNSHGRYRLFMDVDLSTSLDAIAEFLQIMRAGNYDVLIAERKSRAQQQKIPQPWLRRFLGNGFIKLSSVCVGRDFKDFTCGFKMFNQKAVEALFPRQRVFDWSFDTELLAIALAQNLRVGEVAVDWSHHQESTVQPAKAIFTSLAGLTKIRWNMCRGLYR